MVFKMIHENYNVRDLNVSLAFYEKALGLHEIRRKTHPEGQYIIVYLANDQEVFVGMEFGQSRGYSEEIAAKIDREVASILASCYEKAKKILTENKDRLEKLTQALLEQETLNRAEFVALMENGELPEVTKEDKPRTAEEIIRESKEAQAERISEQEEAVPVQEEPAEAQPSATEANN